MGGGRHGLLAAASKAVVVASSPQVEHLHLPPARWNTWVESRRTCNLRDMRWRGTAGPAHSPSHGSTAAVSWRAWDA
eukprot:1039228-Pyramimonas_sp.AAC.1